MEHILFTLLLQGFYQETIFINKNLAWKPTLACPSVPSNQTNLMDSAQPKGRINQDWKIIL